MTRTELGRPLRGYTPRRIPRPYPKAALALLRDRGLKAIDDIWPGYTGYHRIRFSCSHETTYSWSHIRSRHPVVCPTCRNKERFG